MEKHLRIAESLAKLLDSKFAVGRFKFGVDPLLGFIPGVGDVIPLVLSLYIVWVAKEMKVPADKIKTMYRNILLDTVIGAVPFVGDMADFVFHANSKNVEIIRKHAPKVQEGEVI